MVGARGFEPPAPWSQTRCANQTALRPDSLCCNGSPAEQTLVELGGFEPPASSVRRKRAPAALQPLPRVTATILEMERLVVKAKGLCAGREGRPGGQDSAGLAYYRHHEGLKMKTFRREVPRSCNRRYLTFLLIPSREGSWENVAARPKAATAGYHSSSFVPTKAFSYAGRSLFHRSVPPEGRTSTSCSFRNGRSPH